MWEKAVELGYWFSFSNGHAITLTDALNGINFDELIAAVEAEGGSYTNDDGRRLFKTLAYVIKVAGSLLKCAQLKRGAALRNNDAVSLKEADDFLSLHRSEFTDLVLSAAHASYRVRGNTLSEFPDHNFMLPFKVIQWMLILDNTAQKSYQLELLYFVWHCYSLFMWNAWLFGLQAGHPVTCKNFCLSVVHMH